MESSNTGKSPNVEQSIDGEGHQIAGRDIVNYTDDKKIKRLDECNVDELRNEREWSRKLIKDAKKKIRTSWPIKILPFTLILTALIVYLFSSEYFFVIALVPIALSFQMSFFTQCNRDEFKVIDRHQKIVNYVYERLRDFGIDEK